MIQFLTGQAQLLAMQTDAIIALNFLWLILLIIGFVLAVVEMYVPGFGFPGIAGGVCLLGGIALYAKDDIVAWLVMTVIVVSLLGIALSISIRSATKGRISRSKLVLNEVSVSDVTENDLSYYVGKTGRAATVLRPAGMGEFDGVKLNVQSDGEFIAEGDALIVARVEGNRIFVRRA